MGKKCQKHSTQTRFNQCSAYTVEIKKRTFCFVAVLVERFQLQLCRYAHSFVRFFGKKLKNKYLYAFMSHGV